MKAMTCELANSVIDKFDELLALVGDESGGIRKALDGMSPSIESELTIDGIPKEDMDKAREQVKIKVLSDVIRALGGALAMTVTGASTALNKMAGDRSAVRTAVNEYYKSMGVKDGKL